MKKIILIFVFLSSINLLHADLKWKRVFYEDNVTDGYGMSISSIDSLNCMALLWGSDNNINIIVGTSDGGNNWSIKFTKFELLLLNFSLQAPDQNHIYKSQEQGIITKSDAKMSKWDTLRILKADSIYTYLVRPLKMLDSVNGIASCGAGTYLTNDGWKTSKKIRDHMGNAYWMHSTSHFSFVKWMRNFLFTTDGGTTWTYDSVFANPYYPDKDTTFPYIELSQTYFLNDSLGWMAGGARTGYGATKADVIFKTTDGGKDWKQIYFKENQSAFGLFDIAFHDSLNGVAVGAWGKILRTTDGGETWMREFCETDSGRLGDFNTSFGVTMFVAYIGKNPVIVASGAGIFKLMEDTTTSVKDSPENSKQTIVCPNPVQDILTISNLPNDYNYNTTIEIYNIYGLKEIEISYTDKIDVSKLSVGIYYLKINNQFTKFVKI